MVRGPEKVGRMAEGQASPMGIHGAVPKSVQGTLWPGRTLLMSGVSVRGQSVILLVQLNAFM